MKSSFMKSYRSFPSLYKPAPNKTALRATSGTLRADLSGPLIDEFGERRTTPPTLSFERTPFRGCTH